MALIPLRPFKLHWIDNLADDPTDAVRAFYAASSSKQSADDFEQRSFQKLLSEWSRRRSLAGNPLVG
jgi:hypothetical protein